MITHGTYFPERGKASLSPEQLIVVREFHKLYYQLWMQGEDTKNLSWFGQRMIKCPLDLWIYQELLVRTRPDVVVDTGTCFGGSAFYMATILDQIGHGRIITIDIEDVPGRPTHPRISYITGSSVDPRVVSQVHDAVGGERSLVVLDSDHSAAHVYQEILAYQSLVKPGDYLIVEDTNVNGHPVLLEHGPGPMEAVDKFLAGNRDFVIDEACERFLMTLNPRGYLRRTAAGSSTAITATELDRIRRQLVDRENQLTQEKERSQKLLTQLAELAERDKQLAEEKERSQRLLDKLADRESQLAEEKNRSQILMDELAKEQEKLHRQLDRQLVESDSLARERDQLRAEVQRQQEALARVEELEGKFTKREAVLENSVAEQVARAEKLDRQISEFTARLAAFEDSHSWRLTKPLRSLGRFARTIGQIGPGRR